MKLKFLIEIEGDTQPALIQALQKVRERIADGGCYLNEAGEGAVLMKPASAEHEEAFRQAWRDAHPKIPRWEK